MPINLNLKDIETFDGLPDGEYYGELAGISFRPPKQAGKRPQLQAKYLVLDGEQTGRTQSEFITLDTGFLVKWLAAFGLDKDTEGLQIDDEDPNSDEVLLLDGEPILLGSKIIFSVSPDKKDAQYTRTVLTSVEENTLDEAAPAPEPVRAAPARAARATVAPRRAAPVEAQDDADAEPAEAPVAAVRPKRGVAARRPVAAAPRRTLR